MTRIFLSDVSDYGEGDGSISSRASPVRKGMKMASTHENELRSALIRATATLSYLSGYLAGHGGVVLARVIDERDEAMRVINATWPACPRYAPPSENR